MDRPETKKHQINFYYSDCSDNQSIKASSRITYVSQSMGRAGSNSRGKARHLNRIQPKSKVNLNTPNKNRLTDNPSSEYLLKANNIAVGSNRPKQQKIKDKKRSLKQRQLVYGKGESFEGERERGNTALTFGSSTDFTDTANCKDEKEEDKESVVNSISYSHIKPMIGWKKYIALCGMDRGNSQNGCSCSKPCKWAKSWTKSYLPKNKKPYQKLLCEKCEPTNAQQIHKDLPRTYPDCPTFSTNPEFREKLQNVLFAYSIYDSEVGYVQGMNMVAGTLLYHIKEEDQTFWALVELMDEQELRLIYLSGFQMLKNHINQIKVLIQKKIKDLSQHMCDLEVSPDVFLYGWLLSLMSNCIPLEYMHLVIDEYRKRGWFFIYQLTTTYLVYIKEPLLLAEDSCELLSLLNNESAKDIGLEWQQLISNCYKIGM